MKNIIINIQGKELKNAIKNVSFSCVRENKKDGRALLKKIHIVYNGDLKFEATNSRLLSQYVVKSNEFKINKNENFEILISKKDVTDILKNIKAKDMVTMQVEKDEILFSVNGEGYAIKNYSDLSYPGLERAYKHDEYDYEIFIEDKDELLSLIKKEEVVTVKNENNEITVNDVKIKGNSNMDWFLGFNGKYLSKQLKTLKNKNVTIKTAGKFRPLVIEEGNNTQVLAPLRFND